MSSKNVFAQNTIFVFLPRNYPLKGQERDLQLMTRQFHFVCHFRRQYLNATLSEVVNVINLYIFFISFIFYFETILILKQ